MAGMSAPALKSFDSFSVPGAGRTPRSGRRGSDDAAGADAEAEAVMAAEGSARQRRFSTAPLRTLTPRAAAAEAAAAGAGGEGGGCELARARALSMRKLSIGGVGVGGAGGAMSAPPPPMLSEARCAAQDPTGAAMRKLSVEMEVRGAAMAEAALSRAAALETFAAQLQRGIELTKHGRAGKPHRRVVFCPAYRPSWVPVDDGGSDYRCICWTKPAAAEGALLNETESASMRLGAINTVRSGKKTEVFGGAAAAAADAGRCFSLVASDRTLDLECDDQAQRDELVQGFELLLAR